MTEQKPKGVTYSENSSQATLWQFKTVIETGELRYLLILDSYDELPEFDLTELTIAWQEIYQDFSEISGGNRAELWMVKTKRLMGMRIDYERHVGIMRLIETFPDLDKISQDANYKGDVINSFKADLIELAKSDGYDILLDDFPKTFEKAYTRLMRMKRQIGIFQKDSEPEDTNQSLEGTIVTLEKFQGYQFDEHKMNVKRFANILKKYKDA